MEEKIIFWKNLIQKGECALNELKYFEAERIFSEALDSDYVPYLFEEKLIFLWIISLFHLKGFLNFKKTLFLTNFREYTKFQKSFFYLLEITQNKEEFDNAIKHLEENLKTNPELIDLYKKFLIHLPLDFQIIFKMRFF
mgnify:CR=1 FL=1